MKTNQKLTQQTMPGRAVWTVFLTKDAQNHFMKKPRANLRGYQ